MIQDTYGKHDSAININFRKLKHYYNFPLDYFKK